MSPIAHLVVTNAEHLNTLTKLYTQLLDAGQQSEAEAVQAGMFCLTTQLRERAQLLIAMGSPA